MKTGKKIILVLVPAAATVLGCGIDPEVAESPTFQPNLATPTSAAAPATTAAAKPSPTEPAKPKVPTIGSGIWTVGEDVEAGTYKVAETADTYCYWAVMDAQGNIQDNYLGGGRPKVTLKNKQVFETSGCPVWQKEG